MEQKEKRIKKLWSQHVHLISYPTILSFNPIAANPICLSDMYKGEEEGEEEEIELNLSSVLKSLSQLRFI